MKRDYANLTLPRSPGPDAASASNGDGLNELVRESFLTRLWHRVRGFFRTYYRARTPLEIAQAAEIRRLRDTLHVRDVRVFQLEHEVALKTSEIEIVSEEVALWTEVHNRDRLRVQADQAAYAYAAAQLAPADAGRREES